MSPVADSTRSWRSRPGVGSLTTRSPRRGWLRLGLLALTTVVLITLDARGNGALDGVRGTVIDVIAPVRTVGDWAFRPFRNMWRGLVNYDAIEAENEALRTDLAAAQSSALRVGELEQEKRAALALLGARDVVPNIERVAARVIDAPVSNYQRTVELDRGARDGIKVGMPVCSGAGLVGRVVQVGSTRARVELLTDPNFDVGVRVVRSSDNGIASGRGTGRDMVVRFLELESVVIPGETVVTSGFSGSTFPAGLLVGTVVNVAPDAVRGDQEVTVRPSAQVDRLRLVDVILYEADVSDPVIVDRQPESPVGENSPGENRPAS